MMLVEERPVAPSLDRDRGATARTDHILIVTFLQNFELFIYRVHLSQQFGISNQRHGYSPLSIRAIPAIDH